MDGNWKITNQDILLFFGEVQQNIIQTIPFYSSYKGAKDAMW